MSKDKTDITIKEIMTVEEVAKYLNCHSHLIYKMAQRKEIPAFKLGDKMWRFHKTAIDRWGVEESFKNSKEKKKEKNSK